MARCYDAWPWIEGVCGACPQHTRHENSWIMECTQCHQRFCEEWTVDGCTRCGYPFCPQCFRSHHCVPGALLVEFPHFKCRLCPLPQDRGNGMNRCQMCYGCECVDPDQNCPSLLTTTHCCRHDLCRVCASWRYVIICRTIDIPLRPSTRIPVLRIQRKFICRNCLPQYRLHASWSIDPPIYPSWRPGIELQ